MESSKNTIRFEVMIVDDIPDNIQLLASILEREGIDTSFADSGAKALEAIESEKLPDLILLDISMPEMDGYEVCRQLKGNPKTQHIPIIFLTARTQTEDIVKGFELGAVDYVTKPFNTDELLPRVYTHLELKHAQDTIRRQNEQIKQQNEQILLQNKQIQEQNQKLKELNQSKDKFFSIIAHDLKNPFQLLIGLSKLLINKKEKYDAEKQHRFMESMYRASINGYNLLENLLSWSRTQTGRIKWNPEVVDLCTLVDRNIELLRNKAEIKQINLVNQLLENCPVYVDSNMITTVIRNLLSNAIKFTTPGGHISISIEETVEQQFVEDKAVDIEMIKLAIRDTGIGIRPEDKKKLFRIDILYSTQGTDEEQGTGLGLILCKEFVGKNGGQIGFESEYGKGSEFYFTLRKGNTATQAIPFPKSELT